MQLTEQQQDLLDKLFAVMNEDLSNEELAILTLTVLGIEFGFTNKCSELTVTPSKPQYKDPILTCTLEEASEFINEKYKEYLEVL